MSLKKDRKISLISIALTIIILGLLGLWHRGDIDKAVYKTGHTFLQINYTLLVFALLLICVIVACVFNSSKIKLHSAYIIVGLLLGVCYMTVLPGLSAPDEISHYISAYKLSNTFMGKVATADDGYVYIRAEDFSLEDIDGGEINYISGESGNLKSLGQTLDESTYYAIHNWNSLYPEKDGTVKSNLWWVRTTPLVYIPQALGISIARAMMLNSIMLINMGRFFNLLVFITLTAAAIKIIPFGKEILFGIAILPMTLHLSASMSYDSAIMGIAFLFTAQVLRLAYDSDRVRLSDIVVMCILMGIMGPCKLVYSLMYLLIFLIPFKKYRNTAVGWMSIIAVFATLTAAMLLVNLGTIQTYATASDNAVAWSGDSGYTFFELIHQPPLVFKMFYQTLIWQAKQYHLTMIGAYLGNIDDILDVPYIIIVAFTTGLLILALKKPGQTDKLNKATKIYIDIICFLIIAAIMGSMLIAWTPKSSDVITGVQGRYFLPILPLILMTIKNDKIVMTCDINMKILYLFICMNAYSLLRLFARVSMRIG